MSTEEKRKLRKNLNRKIAVLRYQISDLDEWIQIAIYSGRTEQAQILMDRQDWKIQAISLTRSQISRM